MGPDHSEPIELDERHERILAELTAAPAGLGFNELHRRVVDAMAMQTMQNRLEDLQDAGFVSKDPPNPRQGQKVTYQRSTLYKQYQDYRRDMVALACLWIEELAHLLLEYKRGNVDAADIGEQYSEWYSRLVDTLGYAYAVSKQFDGETRRQLLMFAFDVSMAAESVVETFVTARTDLDTDDLGAYASYMPSASIVDSTMSEL
jgi:DNA-binding HxlR family transcriptional regulator